MVRPTTSQRPEKREKKKKKKGVDQTQKVDSDLRVQSVFNC